VSDEITDQMIDDILCAAFEGGINYWADATRILGDWPAGAHFASEAVSRGGNVAVCEADDFERTWHPLDRERIERGIRLAAQRWKRGGTRQQLTVEQWYEDHDAAEADVAVQLAIFGEVVYG
jgi:hypothetical protein